MNMNKTIYISHWTQKYPLIISETQDADFKDIEWCVYIECKDAWFAQERDISDLGKLIELIPDLIDEEKNKKKESVVNIRLTAEEKTLLSKLASEKWYKNISTYARDRLLST